jgi:hypothetical protein
MNNFPGPDYRPQRPLLRPSPPKSSQVGPPKTQVKTEKVSDPILERSPLSADEKECLKAQVIRDKTGKIEEIRYKYLDPHVSDR